MLRYDPRARRRALSFSGKVNPGGEVCGGRGLSLCNHVARVDASSFPHAPEPFPSRPHLRHSVTLDDFIRTNTLVAVQRDGSPEHLWTELSRIINRGAVEDVVPPTPIGTVNRFCVEIDAIGGVGATISMLVQQACKVTMFSPSVRINTFFNCQYGPNLLVPGWPEHARDGSRLGTCRGPCNARSA